MTKSNRLIAVSASFEALIVTSAIFRKGDAIFGTGERGVSSFFDKNVEKNDISELVVVLKYGRKLPELYEKAIEYSRNNVKVVFVFIRNSRIANMPDLSIENCVKVFYVSSQAAEIASYFNVENIPTDFEDFQRNSCLINTIEYYSTKFRMAEYDSSTLIELLDILQQQAITAFSSNTFHPRLRRAVDLFERNQFPYLAGSSDSICELRARIKSIGKTDMQALILGNTGTGKEIVAFFLHDFSSRCGENFVALNCAGLNEEFLHAELFGYKKGAFTGAIRDHKGLVEIANNGTLFLDEISDMPVAVQAELLRFFQTKSYRRLGDNQVKTANVRIITAGQPNIFDKIKHDEFRLDLYYRIAEVTLNTPSLQDVPEDLEKMISYLIYQHLKAKRFNAGKVFHYFNKHINVLMSYKWPGNFRELASLVKRYVLLGDDVVKEIQEGNTLADFFEKGAGGLFDKLTSIHDVDKVRNLYVKAVRAKWPKMSQKSLSVKLGVSENTFKKYLKE